jgi:hypothetical protein
MGKELINFDYNHHGLVDFDDEAEDALSFCDLAMNGPDEDNDYSKGEDSSNFDQDLFEFSSCSGDLSCSSSDSIIFCGKLISYNKDEPMLLAHDQNPYKKSNTINKSRSISEPCQVKKRPHNKTWSMSFSTSVNNKLDFYPVKKVSIIATPVKSSKWPFGVGKSQSEMELGGINKRNAFRSNDDDKNKNVNEKRTGKVSCSLLNFLMFKKRHTTRL